MISRYKSPGSAVISKSGRSRFDNKEIRRSMEIPGPGTYEGQLTFYKTKKQYGVTVFGKQRRLEELQEIKKSNFALCLNHSFQIFLGQELIEFRVSLDSMILQTLQDPVPVLCREDLKCSPQGCSNKPRALYKRNDQEILMI